MDQKIIIKGREFCYNPQELNYENAHIINVDVAQKNLLLFNEVAKTNNFKFILFYGTLLGAIREKGFIKYDTDIDVVTTDEDKILDIIPQLQQKGFIFIRYYVQDHTIIYSLSKDNVYIDIYVAQKVGANKYYLCNSKFPKTFIINLKQISFLGESFFIPAEYEKLFVLLYGKDWRIPKKNCPAYFHKNPIYSLADFFPKKWRNFVKKILRIKMEK